MRAYSERENMKVVEKLFITYLNIPYNQFMSKYTAARSLLNITENNDSDLNKQADKLKDNISARFPISIYKAEAFLKRNETKLMFNIDGKAFELNKSRGDDYKLIEDLGRFNEKINGIVMESMDKYNTDRGRSTAEIEIDFDI